ncbi:glycosyl hydrolase family 95 catalytic domain-containing protein [Labilibacter marinus]|uniref:glycosyl hydrolase family 95 catalytic domain-containing protein n=1 Tax=Labilibacter marinus TaxID=1477105 RepID=UPI000950048B|nr:hypothetical protein [Labilibacter marinus]
MHTIKNILIVSVVLLFSCNNLPKTTKLDVQVDWPEFMKKNRREIKYIPSGWKDAPYFGNAMLGSMLYVKPQKRANNPKAQESKRLRLHVSRADVHGHLPTYEYGWTAHSRNRFEIGDFDLELKGTIQSIDWTQDLWNAELKGTITTNKGAVEIRHYVHADDMIIVTDITGKGEEGNCEWKWTPAEAKSGRGGSPSNEERKAKFIQMYGDVFANVKVPPKNPRPKTKRSQGINTATQNLFGGGQFATAWKEIKYNNTRRLIVSIENTYPEAEATEKAIQNVQQFAKREKTQSDELHANWWHKYYKQSFVSIPDRTIENYYWHMIYTLGCNSRSGRVFTSTQGLWYFNNGWPYATNDWNTEAVLWPVYTANRLDLGKPLVEYLHKNTQTLINNVKPAEWREDCAFLHITTALDMIGEMDQDARYSQLYGCLPWVLSNCWLQYRYSMDESILRETVYPLLRRSLNLYSKLLVDEKGVLHLPKGYSPETGVYKDSNFDLALIKWSCHTLLEINKILEANDPLAPKWQDILNRLEEYPISKKNGYAYGKKDGKVIGPSNHRHASHLLMIYPLRLVTTEDEQKRELLEKSVDHFRNLDERLPAMVTSHAGPMAAALERGDWALKEINDLIPDLHPSGLWHPNTICLEASLGGVTTVQEMALQSWGDVIRVFPAMPDEWKDFTFHNYRGEGAFLVSATRKYGTTEFVRIKSLAGAPCKIRPGFKSDTKVYSNSAIKPKEIEIGVFELKLKKGEEAILWTGNKAPECVIKPIQN